MPAIRRLAALIEASRIHALEHIARPRSRNHVDKAAHTADIPRHRQRTGSVEID